MALIWRGSDHLQYAPGALPLALRFQPTYPRPWLVSTDSTPRCTKMVRSPWYLPALFENLKLWSPRLSPEFNDAPPRYLLEPHSFSLLTPQSR